MKRVWTEEKDNLLRRHYPKRDLDWLAQRLGVTRDALKARARILGLRRKVYRREPWTDKHLDYLRTHYADTRAEDIARKVHHSVQSVWRTAARMGLKKSPEFLAQWGRLVSQTEGAKASQFVKGHQPANKGKRIEEFMTAEGIENSTRTRFRKGHRPANTRAVGTEVVHADGYVFVKVDGGKPVLKQRYVWEQAHGPIPPGYCIRFRDGNRQNCDLSNLEMISRGDSARLCTQNETPEARRERVAKCQVTRNKTIRRDRLRIHWGLEPYTKLVKRW